MTFEQVEFNFESKKGTGEGGEKMEWLKSTRESLGYTQIGFALKLGVSPRTYRAWESGYRKPAAHTMNWLKEKIAEIVENA